jgi:S1-C subfamily serine protease
VVLAIALSAAGAQTPKDSPTRTPYDESVVGLRVTFQAWDQDRPWAKRPPEVRFPLAVVIDRELLLTTAQMVADATFVQVEKVGSAVRVPAKVVRTDPEIDLALLAVDSPGFFDDLAPVKLGDGIPVEGSILSLRLRNRRIESSASRITRIEVQPSSLGTIEHPFVTVITDMRGGGWSEPLFSGSSFLGFSVSQSEQSARVLPVDVIAPFVEMARDGGPYPGFANLSLRWQTGDDPAMAAYLGLEGQPRGVLVNHVPWGSSACGVLRPRDVLLSLDGHAIESDGSYLHPKYGWLRFTYIPVENHRAGDVIPAEVWRDGKLVKLDLTLRRAESANDLVPERRRDSAPPFLVAGGLVFRELDGPYLRSWGDDWRRKAPLDLLVWRALYSDLPTPDRRRILLLSTVFPSAYNIGYHDLRDVPVREINGRPVDTVASAADAFEHPEGKFHRIVLYPNGDTLEVILDAATFEAATQETLESYRIPARMRSGEALPDLGPGCE